MAITKLLSIGESARGNPAGHLKHAVAYICDPKKTDGGLWIGGNAGVTPDTILNSMRLNKRAWGKTDMRQGYHYVLSFPPDCGADENTVMRIAEEFTEELLHGNFLYVIAVHNDKSHLHAHVIFDSVSQKDGYKFHSPFHDWKKRIQPITDRLCKKYGLPTLTYDEEMERKGKNYKEWLHEKEQREGCGLNEVTPYDVIRDDIEEAILYSDTYGDFLNYLKSELNYQITRDKSGLSLRPGWRGKAVRTGRLGPGYSKEDIMQRIRNKAYEPEFDIRHKQYGDMDEIRSVLVKKAAGCPGWNMSSFQRRYVQRYYRVIMIRRPLYDQSWRYRSDILQAKKISRCTVKMLKYDINSLKDVEEMRKKFADGKNAAELKIRSMQTRLYRNEPTRLVWNYNKLEAQYRQTGDEEVRAKMEELMGQILAAGPFEEAAADYEKTQDEIRKLRQVVKDYKADIRTMDDIRTLFYEPEHSMETKVREQICEKKKTKTQERR